MNRSEAIQVLTQNRDELRAKGCGIWPYSARSCAMRPVEPATSMYGLRWLTLCPHNPLAYPA